MQKKLSNIYLLSFVVLIVLSSLYYTIFLLEFIMTKIILWCSAGMSASLFVQKAKTYADEQGIEIEINAISVAELDTYLTDDVDVVVLAPQIRFQLDSVSSKTDKPIMVIEMRDYGMMNIQKVLPEILALVKK